MEDVLSTIFALIPSIIMHNTLLITNNKWKIVLIKSKAILSICDRLISLTNMFPDKLWDWEQLSKNATTYTIFKYPNKPWNFHGLTNNININVKDVIEQLRISSNHDWNWNIMLNDYSVKYNLNTRLRDIVSERNEQLSTTAELILKHSDVTLNWKTILNNPNIPKDIIINNPDINWNWNKISKTMPMHFILEHPHYSWDWNEISCNKNITMNDIRNNLDQNWNWYEISKNPNLKADMILDHLDKPWDWKWLIYSDIILEVILECIISGYNLPRELFI